MRHVVITGASAGIGAGIARELARAGASLTLVARRRDLLEQLAAEVGVPCHLVTADLADPTASFDWLAEAEAALGPIDVLVNNAGVELVARYDQTDMVKAERLLRLNLLVPMQLTRAVLPGMLARGRGTIVDVASIAALNPMRGYVVYAASKAGLAGCSDALRSELLGTGVHVVTVYPGPIRTDMGAAAVEQLEPSPWVERIPWGSAEALARLVRRAIERRRDRVIYPRFYTLSRWFPWLARKLTDWTAPRPRSIATTTPAAPSPAKAPEPVSAA